MRCKRRLQVHVPDRLHRASQPDVWGVAHGEDHLGFGVGRDELFAEGRAWKVGHCVTVAEDAVPFAAGDWRPFVSVFPIESAEPEFAVLWSLLEDIRHSVVLVHEGARLAETTGTYYGKHADIRVTLMLLAEMKSRFGRVRDSALATILIGRAVPLFFQTTSP